MSGHTPGPWSVKAYEVIGSDKHRLAMVRLSYRSSDETEANTRLIAAAPFMLEILHGIAARSRGVSFNRAADIRKMARKAIAKAEGR